ncbi:hypothetical protein IEO21_07849 [Rhodonia placenta]|uniref:Uncharacterized protein n=1 Tax=Rhodonia placenta TaxID=104341 RepID=A0A8H7TZZ3_9APHY|nr:hypothetical protein IEO21_07849 [Postia placenta]
MGDGDGIKDSEERPPCLALITPSLSPPGSRIAPATKSRNVANRAPPAKRPRLASTPSSSISLPSSSASETPYHIRESIKASSLRLLDFWAQLGERYDRPLDEDDIIDLRDGTIVKDRGVLRGSPTKYEMGYFAGDEPSSDANDASSDGGGLHTEGEDEDVDDLDLFAPEANISDELKLEREKLQARREIPMDPADEEDFREFMEAERRRRELHGDADEDDDLEESQVYHQISPHSKNPIAAFTRDDVSRERVRLERPLPRATEVANDDPKYEPKFVSNPRRSLAQYDDLSDDELASWDIDYTTPVKRQPVTPKAAPKLGVIDLTGSPSSSPPRPPIRRGRSQSRAPPQKARSARQAHSRSTPDTSKTPARQKSSMPPPPLPLSPVRQLFTPPLSSSSVTASTPDLSQASEPPLSSPSPSPPPRPKPRPRYKGAIAKTGRKPGSSSQCASSPISHAIASSTDAEEQAGSSRLKRKPSKHSLIPEVLITRRSQSAMPMRALVEHEASSAMEARDHHVDNDGTAADLSVPHRDKGKKRQVSVRPDVPHNEPEDPSLKQSNSSSRLPSDDEDDFLVPPSMPPRSRKRKRIVSSSSSSGRSEQRGSSPNSPSDVPIRSRRSTREAGPSSTQRASDKAPERKPASPQLRSDDESVSFVTQTAVGNGVPLGPPAPDLVPLVYPRRTPHHCPILPATKNTALLITLLTLRVILRSNRLHVSSCLTSPVLLSAGMVRRQGIHIHPRSICRVRSGPLGRRLETGLLNLAGNITALFSSGLVLVPHTDAASEFPREGEDEDEDAGHAQDAPLSSRASRSEIPANRFRRLGARATSVNAEVATLSEAPKKSDKGKGKALVDPASDPDDSEEDAPLARRGRRHERGCTPGPPSHRERLARASAKKAA